MSDMELNKGTLTPFTDEITEDMLDDPEEFGLLYIKNRMYRSSFTIRGETTGEGFAQVTVNEDESIDFFTYHYNGGAGLSEVIEDTIDA